MICRLRFVIQYTLLPIKMNLSADFYIHAMVQVTYLGIVKDEKVYGRLYNCFSTD